MSKDFTSYFKDFGGCGSDSWVFKPDFRDCCSDFRSDFRPLVDRILEVVGPLISHV